MKKLMYVRRDLRSSHGILKSSNHTPKFYIHPDLYEKLSEDEKHKWTPMEIYV